MSDVLSFAGWWLIVTIFGLAAWPALFHLFRFLPDRGYGLAKAGGLMAVGYVGWMLGNLGFARVDAGGVVVSLMVVGGISLLAMRGEAAGPAALRSWWSANWHVVLATEAVFAAAFALWAYVRALNPLIVATEKPMEFAFLNSVLRTATLPPGDPWLAGYAISYYHFGYVIVGMLTALSGVMPSVAFNLGIALLFALTALGAYSVVLNLMAGAAGGESSPASAPGGMRRPAAIPRTLLASALLGPLMMLMGNLNGAVEVAHSAGLGRDPTYDIRCRACPDSGPYCVLECGDAASACGGCSGNLWSWLDIKWTNRPPLAAGSWMPDRYLWWWQSSRVIHDRNLQGTETEVIDEFPFFSFLLGDMHPHVLALPFVFLGIGLALDLFLRVRAGDERPPGRWLPVGWPQIAAGAVVLGGLSFLNTWDFPIYLFVAVLAYTVARGLRDGWVREVWRDALVLAAALAVLGTLLYLPFYISFRSQLGGVLPNVIFGTRLQQFAVMFGPSLLVVLAWLAWLARRQGRALAWRTGLTVGFGLLLGLIAIAAVLALAIMTSRLPQAQAAIDSLLGGASLREALPDILLRRAWRLGLPLLLTVMVGVAAAYLSSRQAAAPVRGEAGQARAAGGWMVVAPFVAVMIITGALLTLGPEFVYLQDLFGTRMNTVFKFYYQAWVLWSTAAAFAAWMLARVMRGPGRALFGAGAAALMATGLVYPILATTTVTDGWRGVTRDREGRQYATLDGMAYMATSRAADYAAIKYLNQFVDGRPVVAEAVGGSYTEYARVSAHTGLPTVLGWPFHELQWGRSGQITSVREGDVQTLYSARTWSEAAPILDRYNVRYVYVGRAEQDKYGQAGLAKFDQNMRVIYQRDGVTIYERLDEAAAR